MRLAVAVLSLSLAGAGAALAQGADRNTLMKPVHQFLDGMNKNDLKGAAGAFAPSASMVDEFAPFSWSGANVLQAWGGDYGRYAQAHKDTAPAMAMKGTPRIETGGDRAYAVVPAVFTFKRAGKAMHEDGTMTFVLVKGGADWKIGSFTWSGGKPQP